MTTSNKDFGAASSDFAWLVRILKLMDRSSFRWKSKSLFASSRILLQRCEAGAAGSLSDRVLPNNQLGLVHPDNLSFGQPIYTSTLIAAAQKVAGVESVSITRFQRQHSESTAALVSGKLELGRLEIARLANDPNFPERGSFTVTNG